MKLTLVTPEIFAAVLENISKLKNPNTGRRIGETVYTYADYTDMKVVLSDDNLSGFAIKPDGDLVSVFSAAFGQGRSKELLTQAISLGAKKLDCFDESGKLPSLYGSFGFQEVRRESWNPEYAPENWAGQTPDVVYMELKN